MVDEDTGRSGGSTDGRLGFKELVAEVGLRHVGLILALETSRLARSSADWHQLLELCALTGTLIADQDGTYAPGEFDDRLLLGLCVTAYRPSLTSSPEGPRAAFPSLLTRYLYLAHNVANVTNAGPHSPSLGSSVAVSARSIHCPSPLRRWTRLQRSEHAKADGSDSTYR